MAQQQLTRIESRLDTRTSLDSNTSKRKRGTKEDRIQGNLNEYLSMQEEVAMQLMDNEQTEKEIEIIINTQS